MGLLVVLLPTGIPIVRRTSYVTEGLGDKMAAAVASIAGFTERQSLFVSYDVKICDDGTLV
jgi:hypothetical protein